ncbi:hypothetical protein H4218_004956 [Coemansia sp. IMI 209128]|nr:hypothetical protein H4218_004956 [Coemansia sp. IMI 209128]
MASTVAERYFAATLHIVFSEIAYYRYLFPDSFFKIVNYENVSVHALIRGKSIESDQLLASVDGACDAMAHECLQTFVIGLSIHPTKHTFIRELYAFQLGYGADYKLLGTRSKSGKTTELFLRRLAALLRQMEALALPILMSMRMALTDNAPPGYTPPGFQSFMAKDVEDYTIYPNCGNTRVGKAAKGESSMFMCCVSVEGPLQTPPLGSMLCSMPMSLEVNRDSQVVVFVAVPSWPTANPETSVVTLPFQQLDSGESCAHEVPMPTTQVRPSIELCITSQENKRNSTAENHPKCECLGPKVDDDANRGAQWVCIKCSRHCHNICYGLAETIIEPQAQCLVCRLREANIAGDVRSIYRLAKLRMVLFIAYSSPSNTVAWLVGHSFCKQTTARTLINVLEQIGLLKVGRAIKPMTFTVAVEDDLSTVPLFSKDIRQVWTAVAEI